VKTTQFGNAGKLGKLKRSVALWYSHAMPRYFFHGPAQDDGGEDLRDDTAAQRMAFDTFGQIIREDATQAVLRMDVVDETGRSVVKLAFSADK
jgi:hypothetical protein